VSRGDWLVVGHGSVGSALARRLAAAGRTVHVHDPAARVPIPDEFAAPPPGPVAHVVSCVAPSAAVDALADVAAFVDEDTLYFDWNTLAPAVKASLGSAAPCRLLDVALLDSMDASVEHPWLLVSGPAATEGAAVMDKLGFHVEVVGAVAGDAARLKLARSIFMKGLEALTLEYFSVIDELEGADVVTDSIGHSMDGDAVAFLRMLLATNRLHAGRRAAELRSAIVEFEGSCGSLPVAEAAAGVLERAAQARAEPS
jgi:3-hydroxyisobutyrate dehydrogenase-like beta-hydroxyacid dehydrogenase